MKYSFVKPILLWLIVTGVILKRWRLWANNKLYQIEMEWYMLIRYTKWKKVMRCHLLLMIFKLYTSYSWLAPYYTCKTVLYSNYLRLICRYCAWYNFAVNVFDDFQLLSLYIFPDGAQMVGIRFPGVSSDRLHISMFIFELPKFGQSTKSDLCSSFRLNMRSRLYCYIP